METDLSAKATKEPNTLTVELLRELWSKTYNDHGKPDWSHILPWYHEDVVFQDAIQRTEGKQAFTELCGRLAKRCKQIRMDIDTVVIDGNTIMLDWTMTTMFRKWPSAPVYGSSKLTLGADGRIIAQRDYYDLWGDIFNGIPRFKGLYRRFMRRYFG